jgi:hypothetical protein
VQPLAERDAAALVVLDLDEAGRLRPGRTGEHNVDVTADLFGDVLFDDRFFDVLAWARCRAPALPFDLADQRRSRPEILAAVSRHRDSTSASTSYCCNVWRSAGCSVGSAYHCTPNNTGMVRPSPSAVERPACRPGQ